MDTIFVVEDERDLQELLRYNLEKNGFRVKGFSSGEECLAAIANEKPALIVLDIMLPGIDGFEVCRRLKGSDETRQIPVVILTARGEDTDIVAGLELGADDYVTKPFSPPVLAARIRSVLRRKSGGTAGRADIAESGALHLDRSRFEAKLGDKMLDLTATEFKILYLLLSGRGRVYTRYQIVERVHGDDYPVTDRSIDVQIVSLRKKLGEYGALIETVRGIGYRFRGE